MRLRLALSIFIVFPLRLNASFIESSIGTAIIEDATATYYNPASLAFIKKKQFVALGPVGRTQSNFSGQFTQFPIPISQMGSSKIQSNYFLPALYYTMPLASKWFLGLAVIVNDFAREVEGFSVLRYAQSNNKLFGLDFVPAIGFKYNKFISIGAGLNRSRASFLLEPVSGFPALDIPDIQSRNESLGDSWGWGAGLFIKPSKKTKIGFNYRSALIFHMHGTSRFNSSPPIISTGYRFDYWVPARTTLSIAQALNSKWGLVGTLQYIQWDIFNHLIIQDLATRFGILPSVIVPHHYHNSWLLTAGTNHRLSSKWVTRFAASYLQSPSEGRFQIDNGDSITLGISTAYTLFKSLILDCSLAHAFILGQNIEIRNAQHFLKGHNKGSLDAFALKLTMNF